MKLPKRLEGETEGQYLALLTYVFLGTGRTIKKAHEEHCERQGKRPTKSNHFARWAAKFNWIARANEYDLAMAEKIHETMVKKIGEQIIDQHQRYSKIIDAQQAVGAKLLRTLNQLSSDNPEQIKAGRESIEGLRSLTATYTNLVNGLDRSHGTWGNLVGLGQLSEKLTRYEQERAGNVIPINSASSNRSLAENIERAKRYSEERGK
jgi:hypothetical protein